MQRLVISYDQSETRAVLMEEGRAIELCVDPHDRPSLVGNVYKGRVENVLAGMDAAFVDIGLGRNGYLHVDEVDTSGRRRQAKKKITGVLKGGQEVLVQVERDAMGGKGQRLTMKPLVVGRHLIFSPFSKFAGVSKRLEQEERERLQLLSQELDTGEGGVILRTAAENADGEALSREMRFLRRTWAGIEKKAAAARGPSLVYREAGLAVRTVRDLLAPGGTVVVDDAGTRRRLVNYLRAVAPAMSDRVELYRGEKPVLEYYDVEREFQRALERRVKLPSGGYIVIDHTEAMTVVDINSGSYVRGKHLEDTILKTNVEASREIVRQLRLRDIGGLIVIDFIDMVLEVNREAILVALKAELARDRTKSYVIEVSPLGLVEMTRQNSTPGLREVMTRVCPTCRGDGRIRIDDDQS